MRLFIIPFLFLLCLSKTFKCYLLAAGLIVKYNNVVLHLKCQKADDIVEKLGDPLALIALIVDSSLDL